jgi:phosphoglycerol transferase MdoB-like AlkP superfamily enzyme
MDKLLAQPTAVLVVLGVLLVVQLSLQVFAIIDLLKRPAAGLTLPKWAWVGIIVLGEILGPIIYLLAGRKPAASADVSSRGATAERAENAADALYGAPKGIGPR